MVEQGVSTRVGEEKSKDGGEVWHRKMVCGSTGGLDMGQNEAAVKTYM